MHLSSASHRSMPWDESPVAVNLPLTDGRLSAETDLAPTARQSIPSCRGKGALAFQHSAHCDGHRGDEPIDVVRPGRDELCH